MISQQSNDFAERLFTIIILLGSIGGAIMMDDPIPIAVIFCIICNVASMETFRMLRQRENSAALTLPLIGALIYPWCTAYTLLHTKFLSGLTDNGYWEFRCPTFDCICALACATAGLVIFALIILLVELVRISWSQREKRQAFISIANQMLTFFFPVLLFSFAFAWLEDIDHFRMLIWLLIIPKLSDFCYYVAHGILSGKIFNAKESVTQGRKCHALSICIAYLLPMSCSYFLCEFIFGYVCQSLPEILLTAATLIFLGRLGNKMADLIKEGLKSEETTGSQPAMGGATSLIASPALIIAGYSILVACLSLKDFCG